MSATNPQDGGSRALDVDRGPIKCGSVERRRLLEEIGIEDRVEFIADAKSAGRQAEEGDHRKAEAGDESAEEDADPHEEVPR